MSEASDRSSNQNFKFKVMSINERSSDQPSKKHALQVSNDDNTFSPQTDDTERDSTLSDNSNWVFETQRKDAENSLTLPVNPNRLFSTQSDDAGQRVSQFFNPNTGSTESDDEETDEGLGQVSAPVSHETTLVSQETPMPTLQQVDVLHQILFEHAPRLLKIFNAADDFYPCSRGTSVRNVLMLTGVFGNVNNVVITMGLKTYIGDTPTVQTAIEHECSNNKTMELWSNGSHVGQLRVIHDCHVSFPSKNMYGTLRDGQLFFPFLVDSPAYKCASCREAEAAYKTAAKAAAAAKADKQTPPIPWKACLEVKLGNAASVMSEWRKCTTCQSSKEFKLRPAMEVNQDGTLNIVKTVVEKAGETPVGHWFDNVDGKKGANNTANARSQQRSSASDDNATENAGSSFSATVPLRSRAQPQSMSSSTTQLTGLKRKADALVEFDVHAADNKELGWTSDDLFTFVQRIVADHEKREAWRHELTVRSAQGTDTFDRLVCWVALMLLNNSWMLEHYRKAAASHANRPPAQAITMAHVLYMDGSRFTNLLDELEKNLRDGLVHIVDCRLEWIRYLTAQFANITDPIQRTVWRMVITLLENPAMIGL